MRSQSGVGWDGVGRGGELKWRSESENHRGMEFEAKVGTLSLGKTGKKKWRHKLLDVD